MNLETNEYFFVKRGEMRTLPTNQGIVEMEDSLYKGLIFQVTANIPETQIYVCQVVADAAGMGRPVHGKVILDFDVTELDIITLPPKVVQENFLKPIGNKHDTYPPFNKKYPEPPY